MGYALPGFVGTAVGAALGWLAVRNIAWSSVLESVARLDWRILLLGLAAIVFGGFLQAYRWKLLLPLEKVSATRLYCVKNAGEAMNNLSPMRVLSEMTQTAILAHRDQIRLSRVVSSIMVCRLFDLVVTINLVGVGLLLVPQLAEFRPFVIPMWILATAALTFFLIFGESLPRVAAFPGLRPLEEILRSLRVTRSRPITLMVCMALTAVSWMSIGVAAWLVAHAVGIGLPFWTVAMLIVAVNFLSHAVPAPPGAIGVYEFVAVYTLGLLAVPPSLALTFALAIHILLILPTLLIGIPVLALEERTLRTSAAMTMKVILTGNLGIKRWWARAGATLP